MLRRNFFGKVHFDVKVLRLKERERGKKFFSRVKRKLLVVRHNLESALLHQMVFSLSDIACLNVRVNKRKERERDRKTKRQRKQETERTSDRNTKRQKNRRTEKQIDLKAKRRND
jgi:hypothetical protein